MLACEIFIISLTPYLSHSLDFFVTLLQYLLDLVLRMHYDKHIVCGGDTMGANITFLTTPEEQAKMLADVEQTLSEFAVDYKSMAEPS